MFMFTVLLTFFVPYVALTMYLLSVPLLLCPTYAVPLTLFHSLVHTLVISGPLSQVCPSQTCRGPLNVAHNATFDLITDLLNEMTGA